MSGSGAPMFSKACSMVRGWGVAVLAWCGATGESPQLGMYVCRTLLGHLRQWASHMLIKPILSSLKPIHEDLWDQ